MEQLRWLVDGVRAWWAWSGRMADALFDARPSDRPSDPVEAMWHDAYWPLSVPEAERDEAVVARCDDATPRS